MKNATPTATVKESLTAQPATEESSTPQPAPGETPEKKHDPRDTPETDAEELRVFHQDTRTDIHDIVRFANFARTLERQRDQAREELAACKWRIAELENALEASQNARGQVGRLKVLIAEKNVALDAANADRARLREALEMAVSREYRFINDTDESATEEQEGFLGAINKALSTPPEMVVRQAYEAFVDDNRRLNTELLNAKAAITELNNRLIDRTSGMLDGQVRVQQMPSAKSFRAGWDAAMDHHSIPGASDQEAALRKWMADNEPKGKTLAELKGGEA